MLGAEAAADDRRAVRGCVGIRPRVLNEAARAGPYTPEDSGGDDMTDRFQLVAPYKPAGDQQGAIQRLSEGFEAGLAHQTLLGVTGSGKTYTIANVIEKPDGCGIAAS